MTQENPTIRMDSSTPQPPETAQSGTPGGSAGTYSGQTQSADFGTAQRTIMMNQPTPSFAWLAILTGIHSGRLVQLNPEGTSIGRDAQNDIILDDTAVSRLHAKVKKEAAPRRPEQFYVQDLGSSNGTFVNDKKIVRKALNDGDVIRIGETRLAFKIADPSAAKPKAKKARKRGGKR